MFVVGHFFLPASYTFLSSFLGKDGFLPVPQWADSAHWGLSVHPATSPTAECLPESSLTA